MNYLRKGLLWFGVLLLIAAGLLWVLPARWVMPWVQAQLQGLSLQQVHGSVWEGRADQVLAADGHALGQLRWRISRRALLGQMRGQLDFDGPQLAFAGFVERLPDNRIALRQAHVRVDLAMLDRPPASPLGQPLGELQLSIGQALLQGGWPLQLQAQAQWRRAIMRTIGGDVVLGNLRFQAQAQGGVIDAQVRDDEGGPLHVDGQLQLSPLGWRLDATLRPLQTDPALRHWLAGLGPLSADGSVHVRRSGGLAAGPPLPPSK